MKGFTAQWREPKMIQRLEGLAIRCIWNTWGAWCLSWKDAELVNCGLSLSSWILRLMGKQVQRVRWSHDISTKCLFQVLNLVVWHRHPYAFRWVHQISWASVVDLVVGGCSSCAEKYTCRSQLCWNKWGHHVHDEDSSPGHSGEFGGRVTCAINPQKWYICNVSAIFPPIHHCELDLRQKRDFHFSSW